ncbi:MAG: hypothetical protein IT385_12095 [Deltaproteobacteria bacterium]|nr:hypothetical protein [Deltaproteobacteria bacterium]
MVDDQEVPHQPFYCEENAWRLLATTTRVAGPAEVVLVANRFGRVACWAQRAADARELPVLWDYHVVVAEVLPDGARRIWDPDSWLGPIVPAATWLAATFLDPARVRERFHPRFRLVPRARWVAELATDRAHMRDRRGRWLKPPPPWEPPGAGRAPNLFAWLDQDHTDWIDRPTLEARWGLASS